MEIIPAHFDYQFVIIPTFGIINRSRYFGYPVFCISFLWLCFGISFRFGVKKGKHIQSIKGDTQC